MEGKAVLLQAVLLCYLIPIAVSLIVETTSGRVRGKITPEAYVFLGIPYAEPPVRQLRWKSPVRKTQWRGIYDATYLRSRCPQGPCDRRYLYGNQCSNEYSEDCLHLNIYVPHGSMLGRNKAVMVFIHGGFFEAGSGVFPLFHGDSFVRKGGVILVTLNYRIGALGSLFTDREGIRGNFGIQDQRLAMEWVYRNIRRFGGNNRRITIFGRSAGASYIGMHLVNRKADRFFRGAIMMSAGLGIATKTTDQALSVGRSFSEKLNCDPDDTVCLRSRSVKDVLTAQASTSRDSLSALQRFVTWEPFPDNNEIPTDLQSGLRNGLIGDDKRVIIGVTAEENKQFVLDVHQQPVPLGIYRVLVTQTLPDQAEGVLQRYAPADPTDARPELTYFLDDIIFTCPARRVAIDLSKYRPGHVYFYVFDNGLTFLRGTNINVPCQEHACHGNENGFLFQTITKLGFQLSPTEKRLGYQLTTSWTNFAKSGNPSFPRSLGESFWPPYLLSNNERYSLIYRNFTAPRTTNEQDFRGEMCDEYDQNGFHA